MPGKSLVIVILSVLLIAGALGAAGEVHAARVNYFIVQYPVISPNGDGTRDSSAVRVSLGEQCDLLTITVEDASMGLTLDTLLRVVNPSPGIYAATWKGEDSLGAVLPDGNYWLHLVAWKGGTAEHHASMVIVDTTGPLVHLDRIDPGIYAPNVPGSLAKVIIYFTVSRYGFGDTLFVRITDPKGASVDVPAEITGDGPSSVEWSAQPSATDGLYGVSLHIADVAGNSSSDSGMLDVDTKAPTHSFIGPPLHRTKEIPESLWGRCYDRNGTTNLSLKWHNGPASRDTTVTPDSTFMRGDTLVWRFDAIKFAPTGGYTEGSYSLTVRCSDIAGHEITSVLYLMLDLTAPPPAVLSQPSSPVRDPNATISGTVDENDTYVLYLYQVSGTNTVTDTFGIVKSTFREAVTLFEGENEFWAIAQDSAGNMSGQSNRVYVTYEEMTGFFFPEVFRAAGAFEIYTGSVALEAVVTIFTINGERVVELRKAGPATKFEIPWNLKNGDGDYVRNGPYLVVLSVSSAGGTVVEKKFVAVVR